MDSLEQHGVPLLAPHTAAMRGCVEELQLCLRSLGSLVRQQAAVDAVATLVLSLVRRGALEAKVICLVLLKRGSISPQPAGWPWCL